MKPRKEIPARGVVVIEGKKWKTKKAYTFCGFLACTYSHQPKRIRFQSRMTSDDNQHLCGGWRWFDNAKEEIERRLVCGLKPLGELTFESKLDATQGVERLKAAGLDTKMTRGHLNGLGKHWWHVEACQPIRVRDIGDLELLKLDYADAFPAAANEISAEVEHFADRRLKSFFGRRWDAEDCPLWLTGLILGYPVENSISLKAGWVA